MSSNSLIKYVVAFNEFEKYINDINYYSSNKPKQHHGYLINIDQINNIKKRINYEQNKNIYIKKYNIDQNSKKILTINELEFRNSNYLLNMMFNGNEFIIINTNLWQILCQENKENATCIIYEIDYNYIQFKLDDKRELYFQNTKNNQFSLKTFYNEYYTLYDKINSYFNETIINIYNNIIDFNNFRKKFLQNLNKTHKSDLMSGYLVDIDWFKNWEKYNDYSNIKSKYLDKNQSKKEIINYIIYIQQINKIKNICISEPRINQFVNREQLESFLKKNILIIINTSLIKTPNNFMNKIIYFQLYNKKIEFYFQSQEPLIVETESNFITIKNKNIEHPNLLQLSRIFYFRKYLREEILKGPIKNVKNSMILIKKDIIDKYTKNYNYEKLSKFLNTINLDYTNLKQKYEPLLNALKTKNDEYYKEFIKRENFNNLLNFIGKEYDLIPQRKNINGINLNYFSDFEIIDNDIFTFFVENKMFDESKAIRGEYIAIDGKILLIFEYKNRNFYQIGNFDKENENFVLEYILEESSCTKRHILNYFEIFGIQRLSEQMSKNNNKISYGYDTTFYCYQFINENGGNNELINNKEKPYNIVEIASILMTLNLLEKDIKNKLEYSKTIKNDLNSGTNYFSTKYYKLVSEDFIRQIKELFNYQKIKRLMKQSQINNISQIKNEVVERELKKDDIYTKFLFDKQKEFQEIQKNALEFFKIETITFEKGNDKFSYPIKFNILDEILYDKFTTILKLKENLNAKETNEISLTYNNGYITFNSLKSNFSEKYKYLSYIYSINEHVESSRFNYHPEAVLDFQSPEIYHNQFSEIMKENIMYYIMQNPNVLINNFHCKSFLLFNKKEEPKDSIQQPINTSFYLSDNNMDNFWNKLLLISYKFHLEYTNFYDFMKIYKNVKNEKFYLINKNYIDKIKIISNFEEIRLALERNAELKKPLLQNNSDCLIKLKGSLTENILTKFYFSKKEDIEKDLNDQKLYDKSSKSFMSSSNKLFYYENFQIINQRLFEILKDLDYYIDLKCNQIDLIISPEKVILLVNEKSRYLINVGNINDNDIFTLDYIIKATDLFQEEFEIRRIFKMIKENGYSNFKSKYIQGNKIIIDKDFKTDAYIFKESDKEKFNDYNIQTDSISEKLKGMILLAISQNIDINKFHEFSKNIEKVYLINCKYLSDYKYEEISSLLNQNIQIRKLIEEINDPQNTNNTNIPEKLEEIISKLDTNKLKAIDQALQIASPSYTNWEATPDKIALQYMKDINVYKNFVLIKEKLFKEIKNKLGIYITETNFEYFYKDNADILVINNYSQPSIFYGYMNRESFMFNLTYILYFDYQSDMKKELEFVRDYGIKKFINEKTIFNEEDTKDLISPIYNEKSEIGTFYKYSPGTNYGDIKKGAYSSYIENSNLKKILKLYNYYNDFKENTNGYYEKESKYYLINKSIMDDIKKDYNYDLIIEILKKGQYNRKEKNEKRDKLFILKNLPEEVYEDFIKNNKQIEKRMKDFIAPNQISITIPNSQNESVNIYDNFEIIDSYNASQFISEISDYQYSSWGSYGYGSYVSNDSLHKDKNYVECTLKSGKIIIYYPKGELNKDKHVYIIGTLDKKNTFKGEYLLFYTKDHNEFNKIKYKLSDYLKNLDQQLMYGPSPITNSSFEEIGKVLSLKELSSSNIQKMDIDNNTTSEPMDVVDEQYDFYNDNLNNEEKKKNAKKGLTTITKGSKFSEYNLDALVQSNSIQKNFGWPPLIGLDNIGATCYMNATLQCLCNIPKFINYFKYNKHLIDEVRRDLINTKNSTLSSSFKLLMEKLWPDRLYHFNVSNSGNNLFGKIGTNNTYSNKNNESYAPYEFKAKISKMNDLFKGVAANDAKDLVQFLIMTLHKELNLAQNQNLNNNAINQDQTNKQLMFKIFTQDFVNTNKSIISDLFYGVNYNTIQCQGCFTKSYNFQTYFF